MAVAQAPGPLQEFIPEHFTPATLVAVSTAASFAADLLESPAQPDNKSVTVAVVKATPDHIFTVFILILYPIIKD